MPKYKTLSEYVDTFNTQALEWYETCKSLMSEISKDVKVRLFAGQVAFYIEDNLKRTFHESPVVVMAFFNDHVNVFATGTERFKQELQEYRFTKKGTMQIDYNVPFNKKTLKELFIQSLQ